MGTIVKQIPATVVFVTYGLTTSQSVALNAVLKYDTKIRDLASPLYNVSTGLLTVPFNALCEISVVWTPASANSGCYALLAGAGAGFLTNSSTAGGAAGGGIPISVTQGQTLGIAAAVAGTINGIAPTGFVNQVTFKLTAV
jgi:hypothetical protein